MQKRNFILSVVASAMMALTAQAHAAETEQVTIAYQFGWSYTPFHVMKNMGLVDKHAKAAGINLKVDFKNMGSPGIIRDGMLAGQVQYGAVGVPTLITLADKTNGDYKAVGNIVSVPMNFNINTDSAYGQVKDLKQICDIQAKVALPTIKSSVQAVTFQMFSQKHCGEPFKLDSNTISLSHPDGMTQLLTNQVGGHFTSPPFNDLEIDLGKGKVKPLFDSYDVLGGPTSFILFVGSEKFRQENPKVNEVIAKAFEEAVAWTKNNKQAAAELYVKEEKSKEQVSDVVAQMSSPKVIFDTTPNNIGAYSSFMKNIGTVKKDMDWKYLSMPHLHSRKGS